jgi:hypothetical protein
MFHFILNYSKLWKHNCHLVSFFFSNTQGAAYHFIERSHLVNFDVYVQNVSVALARAIY